MKPWFVASTPRHRGTAVIEIAPVPPETISMQAPGTTQNRAHPDGSQAMALCPANRVAVTPCPPETWRKLNSAIRNPQSALPSDLSEALAKADLSRGNPHSAFRIPQSAIARSSLIVPNKTQPMPLFAPNRPTTKRSRNRRPGSSENIIFYLTTS
jgi:hypothetical protein